MPQLNGHELRTADAKTTLFRPTERVRRRDLLAEIARTPMDHYVIWTGEAGAGRPGSLRSRALGCVAEPWTPVPLRELLNRAAALDGDQGYDPVAVRRAVFDHQRASPAVYLLTRRLGSDLYLAVTDVASAGLAKRRLQAGDPVLAAGSPWGGDTSPPAAGLSTGPGAPLRLAGTTR